MAGRSCAFEPLEQRVLCASIALNLSQTYQTIQGLGGNYARAKYGDFFVESIAAFLKRADETYGVRVDYISLNEADGGFNLKFTSTEQASLIKLAGPLFSQLGLSYTPKWLVGDTGNASRCVKYCTTILSDPGAAPYLGPISFHGWDSLTYPDSTLTAI